MKTPVTMSRIKHHFHYNAWKYLLLCIGAIFTWNLVYTTTAYRPPEDKKINFYVSSSGTNSELLDAYLAQLKETVFSDMEELSSVVMASNDGSDPYVTMQLSTYIMAGEGDVYLLNRNDFMGYATGGGMLPLEGHLESGDIQGEGLDLDEGYQTEEDTGETHLYGIPTDQLYGLMESFGIDNRGKVLCVLVRTGNEQNAVKFINQLILDMKKDKPEWLDDYDAAKNTQQK